jgi:hypothetical protein
MNNEAAIGPMSVGLKPRLARMVTAISDLRNSNRATNHGRTKAHGPATLMHEML